jgi:uncharacterized protein DUF3179
MVIQEVRHFDAGRAMLEDYLDGYPARLMVTEAQPLESAVAAGQIAPDARMLAFEYGGALYAVPMTVVLSYNVIQGEINQQPWMMTFCNACNTGMVFNPVVEGQTLHFRRRGAYDGLLLIWDEETGSYWQHITGQCLYGTSQGQQLRMVTPTRQMSAAEAANHSSPLLLTSVLTEEQQKLSRAMEKMRANPERLETGIVSTIGQGEDTRRPRFELGLGVWSSLSSTFFPLTMLYAADSVLMTEFDGRLLLIYQTPGAIAPVAAYLDVRHPTWEREVLRLDAGASIQNDVYITSDGQSQPLDRPLQLLMRWYGFALTFPGCSLPNL